MNLTLTEKGKKFSFEKFVEVFGEHFKALSEPLRTEKMKEVYTKETGSTDYGDTGKKRKQSKEL
jgi:hypothetical protein